jgi:hypothetical protein
MCGDDVKLEPSVKQWQRDIPGNYNPGGEFMDRRGDISVFNIVEKRTTIIDVRTCTVPVGAARIAGVAPVELGENAKRQFYDTLLDRPDNVDIVPVAIDTFGRWGEAFKAFAVKMCKRAAGGDHKLYNVLITRFRNSIQAAHAHSAGLIVKRALGTCVSDADRMNLAQRPTGRTTFASVMAEQADRDSTPRRRRRGRGSLGLAEAGGRPRGILTCLG